MRWNQHYNYKMSSGYSQVWDNINKKVMKSFYVPWSDKPDLKLAWSSATALFKLFPLGPLWRQFFFNKYRFCFFLSNSFTKSCYRMINWKNLFWMSTINTSLEKGFDLRYVTSFLFSILQNTFITINFIWVIHLWCSQKMTNFTNPFPPPPPPPSRPFCSQKIPHRLSRGRHKCISV